MNPCLPAEARKITWKCAASGTPPQFSFEPKAHWDLGPELGILDFERAAKITGARFAVYWDLGAKLERALINFMLDVHTEEHGYKEVLPPFMVNSASLYGTGQLPKFEADLFKLQGTDYYLIPTAEVPVTNLYRDETLDMDALPIQLCRVYAVFSQRSRILRPRCARNHPAAPVSKSRAGEILEARIELTKNSKSLHTTLKTFWCVSDCRFEPWFSAPATWAHRRRKPTTSKSGCRARTGTKKFHRARISKPTRPAAPQFADDPGRKSEYVHTLNGSGLAVGRTWVAIVENYQQADGSVVVPEALRPYLGVEVIRRAKNGGI